MNWILRFATGSKCGFAPTEGLVELVLWNDRHLSLTEVSKHAVY